MAAIELRPFTTKEAEAYEQGPMLRQLVVSQKNWLRRNPQYSGAYLRYDRRDKSAATQVLRLGSSDAVRPYILLTDPSQEQAVDAPGHVAIGIGTLIGRQYIAHPGEELDGSDGHLIIGTDVDYWLAEPYDGDDVVHDTVAAGLAQQGVQLAQAAGEHLTTLFATVVEGRAHQPIGVKSVMKPYGTPARLAVPAGAGDTYGITRNGAVSQLYIAELSVAAALQSAQNP
jgi:hypothetical protein